MDVLRSCTELALLLALISKGSILEQVFRSFGLSSGTWGSCIVPSTVWSGVCDLADRAILCQVRGSVLKLRDGRVKAPDGLEYQSGILLVFVKLRRRDEAFT